MKKSKKRAQRVRNANTSNRKIKKGRRCTKKYEEIGRRKNKRLVRTRKKK